MHSIEPTTNFYNRDGMYTRLPIMYVALMIEAKAEWAVEFLLAEQPEILKLIKWDFNKRIEFLTSLKALTEIEKGKFTLFQRIRNKFAHDIRANSLVNCFKRMNKDPEDMIFNLYPQDKNLPMEDRLHNAVQQLINDIGDLLEKIQAYVNDYMEKHAKAFQFYRGYETTLTALVDTAEHYVPELARRLKSTNKIQVMDLAQIPAEIIGRANAEALKRVRVAMKELYKVDLDLMEQKLKVEARQAGSPSSTATAPARTPEQDVSPTQF